MPSYSRRVQIPGKSSQELYNVIDTEIDRFLSKSSLGKYEVERDAGRKELRIKSSMFSGTLSCREAEMELSGQLSFLAAPFKSKLDDGIDRWMSKVFNI
jgi:hypothetical protein